MVRELGSDHPDALIHGVAMYLLAMLAIVGGVASIIPKVFRAH